MIKEIKIGYKVFSYLGMGCLGAAVILVTQIVKSPLFLLAAVLFAVAGTWLTKQYMKRYREQFPEKEEYNESNNSKLRIILLIFTSIVFVICSLVNMFAS